MTECDVMIESAATDQAWRVTWPETSAEQIDCVDSDGCAERAPVQNCTSGGTCKDVHAEDVNWVDVGAGHCTDTALRLSHGHDARGDPNSAMVDETRLLGSAFVPDSADACKRLCLQLRHCVYVTW